MRPENRPTGKKRFFTLNRAPKMDAKTKIADLHAKINELLRPLIDRDFRLLEVPDYGNPGDMLIFQGEEAFLRTLPYRCLEASTMSSFAARHPPVGSDELLVFSGGGYFGDLYPRAPDFQRAVLDRYPENPALILPQSVFFGNRSNLEKAIEFYGKRRNLTICLRDRRSYEFIREHFPNPAVLVPDMAFFADLSEFRETLIAPEPGRRLLLARNDAELHDSPELAHYRAEPGIEIADWPSMVKPSAAQRIMNLLRRHPGRFGKLIDWHAKHGFRKSILRRALGLLAPYETVISTRLHGAIMALLTGRQVAMLDNSYGKNRSLYETWLSDCSGLSFVDIPKTTST